MSDSNSSSNSTSSLDEVFMLQGEAVEKLLLYLSNKGEGFKFAIDEGLTRSNAILNKCGGYLIQGAQSKGFALWWYTVDKMSGGMLTKVYSMIMTCKETTIFLFFLIIALMGMKLCIYVLGRIARSDKFVTFTERIHRMPIRWWANSLTLEVDEKTDKCVGKKPNKTAVTPAGPEPAPEETPTPATNKRYNGEEGFWFVGPEGLGASARAFVNQSSR